MVLVTFSRASVRSSGTKPLANAAGGIDIPPL